MNSFEFNSQPIIPLAKKIEKENIDREKENPVDLVFDNPEVRSYMNVVYDFPEYEGRELHPKHQIEFVIPEAFRNRVVRDVIIRHRKANKYAVDIGQDRHDPHGAYSRFEIYNPETEQWTGWKDPKGYDPDKFAEPRPANDPENENLHDWIATVGEVKGDRARITNVGKDELGVSQIHGIEIIFYPEQKDVKFDERIYCQGTKFVDLEKNERVPLYGGGSFNEGRYTGAIALNQKADTLYELGNDPGPDVKKENGALFISLKPDRKLVQVEVSIGDTEHLNSINPKTGRHTRLGYAKLWAGIKKKKNGEIEWFIQNANIPPQGVLAGGPHLENNTIEEGDELVIQSRDDTAYLMGYRLAYEE